VDVRARNGFARVTRAPYLNWARVVNGGWCWADARQAVRRVKTSVVVDGGVWRYHDVLCAAHRALSYPLSLLLRRASCALEHRARSRARRRVHQQALRIISTVNVSIRIDVIGAYQT